MTPARALAVVVALSTVARAETRPHYGGKLEASLLGAPATLDPAAAQSHAELTVAELVFDTLYHVELSGPEPHVAAALPELDAAGTKAKIALRKGIKFHDGTALTPQDVAASLDRARTSTGRWALATIAQVKANGDGIELVLTVPATPGELAQWLALAPASITKHGKPPGEKPIGTGPFAVDGFDRKTRRLALRAFDDHFAGRPYLDRLVLSWFDTPDGEARQFETGAAQLSARGVAAFTTGQPKFKASFVDGSASLLLFVGFGKKHADVTNDRGFRRALELAIDRGVLASINKGEAVLPAAEPMPGSVPSATARTGDIAQAKAQLAQAASRVKALAPGAIGSLSLEIAFDDSRPDDRDLAERLARALGKLGVASTLSAYSANVLRDHVQRGTTDLYIGQLAAPSNQPAAWWSAAFSAGGDDWAAGKLAAGALVVGDAQKEFAQRLPIIPLMFRGVRMWHRTDIRGLRFDTCGRPGFADVFLFGQPVAMTKLKP